MAEESETTLRRGMSILFALGSTEALEDGGLGVVRIAEIIGREKSQASRTLKTLEACGLLTRDPESLLYRLSWELFALASRAGDHHLVEAARQVLEVVVARVEETAYLTVMQGTDVLTVLCQQSARIIQSRDMVGQTTPAYCSSAGRALLMDQSEAHIRLLFADVTFEQRAPNAPRDVDDLIARVAQARGSGIAVAEEEFEPGLLGIAAPVRDSGGRIVAAVNVSGPNPRLAERLPQACAEISSGARELSTQLGWGAVELAAVGASTRSSRLEGGR